MDPLIKSQLLYQLSYAPGPAAVSRQRPVCSKAVPGCPGNAGPVPAGSSGAPRRRYCATSATLPMLGAAAVSAPCGVATMVTASSPGGPCASRVTIGVTS